jgi:hypothetical protein
LGLSAPSPIEGNNKNVLSWHKVESRNLSNSTNYSEEITINFGKFWKCGYYDWRLVSVSDNGNLVPLEIVGSPEA